MAEAKRKPIASLSLDLDNQWSYMKMHGRPGWEDFPSYLDLVVPRVLDFLERKGVRITFFIVGKDAVLGKNREALRSIAEAGHEIANHSFHHEPWFHLSSRERVREEIVETEKAVRSVTGVQPIGFRGPGFSLSESVLAVLQERGYLYDASTFPTFLGPLARAYYFSISRLEKEDKAKRKRLFGTFQDGFRPLKPYRWKLEKGSVFEIPVTTMPLFRTPVHASYLLYLARLSTVAAGVYWRTALVSCRLTGVQPSLLLHPLDFLGCDDTDALSFFPTMDVPTEKKLRTLECLLDEFFFRFEVLCMKDHARRIESTAGLRMVRPRFRHGRR